MTSRAGRHLAYFGFAALIGAGWQASPAAAQSYLADNNSSGSVTVDYSVLGAGMAGPSAVTRSTLPGSTCSCASAPLGVIAAAPRPTFNNPFNASLAMRAPAVPPGFMTYAQATGAPAYAGSSGGAVVLHAPAASQPQPQMAEMTPPEPAPAPTPPVETTTQTPPTPPAETTETQAAELPKTTKTQSQPSAESAETTPPAAAAGGETAPPPPEAVPDNVPSPVGPGDTVANVSQAPAAAPPPSTENQNTETPAPETPLAAETPTANTQSTETPATPPAEQPPAEQPSAEQQAAVTPTPPAEGTTPPAEGASPNSGATVPAGGFRILYTGDSDDVPATATGDLDKVAADMNADQNKRIQILAYAAGTEDTESKARRKSLARGLAIRSYLIKAGVPSTRIDVRALGSKADGGPADRVDIVPAS
jgi:outer membrane protein OmpA-like peptidoglycan-associated protein